MMILLIKIIRKPKMPFNPDTVEISYKKVTGKSISAALKNDIKNYISCKSPHRKADAINTMVNDLITETNKQITSKIMVDCGTQCIGTSTIAKARVLFKKSKDIKEFLQKLNEKSIGGGRLKLSEGIVTGGYDRCYCGSVSKSRIVIPLEYCSCSAGWYKKLFEETLSKEVEVEIKNSIINGSISCDFKIYI